MMDPAGKLTFEQSLTELERIVHALEEGNVSLEDSLTQYESGIGLLKKCYERLRQVEQRIVELTGIDADGNPVTRPFEHTATVEVVAKSNGNG